MGIIYTLRTNMKISCVFSTDLLFIPRTSRNMKFVPELNVLVTSSWDGSVRVWDARSPQPVAAYQLSERAYAMDAKNTNLVGDLYFRCVDATACHVFLIRHSFEMTA